MNVEKSGQTLEEEANLNFDVVILAAGLSSRMKEGKSKALKYINQT